MLSRTKKANSRTLQHFVSTIGKTEEKHVSPIKNNIQHTSHLGKIEKNNNVANNRFSSSQKPTHQLASSPNNETSQQYKTKMEKPVNYYKETPSNQPVQPPLAGRSVSGWEGVLSQNNSGSFSDVTANLGYVIAMLPDMLINMFTGKNQNFRFENNLLPIASIFGGMFVKNPFIKMLMVGLGGASLVNSAGNELLSYDNPDKNKVYRNYPDEPLNSRLSDPAVKGSSLFVDIDNTPMVINISKNAAIAYRDGYLPLNTLANKVLKIYDQQMQAAETNYNINETAEKDMERQVALR